MERAEKVKALFKIKDIHRRQTQSRQRKNSPSPPSSYKSYVYGRLSAHQNSPLHISNRLKSREKIRSVSKRSTPSCIATCLSFPAHHLLPAFPDSTWGWRRAGIWHCSLAQWPGSCSRWPCQEQGQSLASAFDTTEQEDKIKNVHGPAVEKR